MGLNDILKLAIEENASDIHLKVGYSPLLRIEGLLKTIDMEKLGGREVEMIMEELVGKEKREILDRMGNVDTSFQTNFGEIVRYRINAAKDMNGYFLAMRLIPRNIRKVSEIGFPNDIWKEIVTAKKGLVLVTGITNSGKTTTLASIIQEINRSREEHIITIEDPIEYVHQPIKSIISQREIGSSLISYADGVKYALRQDPNVLFVAEIRDRETAEGALEAAATGHLVFATIHTKSTDETTRRYTNLFPAEDHDNIMSSLAANLSFILSQQLIPYQNTNGRILAMEILNVRDSSSVQNKIRKGENHQILSDLQTQSKIGMISMEQHLVELVKAGKIPSDRAELYAYRKDDFKQRIN